MTINISCYNNYCYCKLINMHDTFVSNPSFFKLDATLKKSVTIGRKLSMRRIEGNYGRPMVAD